MEVEISIFRAQTGHPQSSCHLQLHPPCQWTKMAFQTARDQPPRFYHIIPGLCQLVKDQFVAMLASVGEFQTKGCFPCFFCLKWREILGYQNFKVLQKLAEKKKAWLYPKKAETTGRLKVSFLPPFCNQRYRCCTACWRSSHFLCSAWNTCRPALQLNRTADFKYLIRRYNQLTLPPCILLRPPKTSILQNKKACAPIHLFTKQDASITLYSFSAASLKKLARISPPSASSNSTWKTFGIQHVIQSSHWSKATGFKIKTQVLHLCF